jgi:metaxin
VIDAQDLYTQAEEAFAALEMVLGKDKWFFGAKRPGLFDASVFAYTHLLLDDSLGKGWMDTCLRDAVRSRKNLVRHRERILASYFSTPARAS